MDKNYPKPKAMPGIRTNQIGFCMLLKNRYPRRAVSQQVQQPIVGIRISIQEGAFMADNKRGRSSFLLPQPPVITAWASVAGKKESEGPLAHTFDKISQDPYFGQKTW